MREKREKAVAYIILVILAIVFALPLAWIIFASLDKNASLAASLPNMTLGNYRSILMKSTNLRSFANGLLIALGTSILVVAFSGLASYALSRYEMKHKKLFMLTILFMNSLPVTTIMVPVFKIFVTVGLYNKLFGIVLFMTASSMPYAIWMMKNFMDSVPVSRMLQIPGYFQSNHASDASRCMYSWYLHILRMLGQLLCSVHPAVSK